MEEKCAGLQKLLECGGFVNISQNKICLVLKCKYLVKYLLGYKMNIECVRVVNMAVNFKKI